MQNMSVFGYFPIIFAHILFSANNAFWPFPTGQLKKKELWHYIFCIWKVLSMVIFVFQSRHITYKWKIPILTVFFLP